MTRVRFSLLRNITSATMWPAISAPRICMGIRDGTRGWLGHGRAGRRDRGRRKKGTITDLCFSDVSCGSGTQYLYLRHIALLRT
jgi:hypothetical protein